MSFTPRPFQESAIGQVRALIAKGHKRIVLCSPTGSGKTEMGMMMIRGGKAKNKKMGFIANRIGLVGQTSKRLSRAGLGHGVLQGQNSRREYEYLMVCSIQTIAKRGLIDGFDVFLIDECHGVPGSKDYVKLMEDNPDAIFIGLTATPFAKGMAQFNERLKGPMFETMVVAAQYSELIELGFLVDADVYAPSEPDMKGAKMQRNAAGEQDYSDLVAAERSNTAKLVGDIVHHWLKLGEDKPTVCFACDIAHSKHIVQSFNEAGIVAEHIDCYTPEEERLTILARVESGVTRVISNVGILTEGWDFPACEVMILARPTKSLIRYMQMAGRVLRPSPGKERAVILDHSGSALRLGLPTEDRVYTLNDGTVVEERDPGKPEPERFVSCGKCHHVYLRAGNSCCPKCQFKPTLQPRDVGVREGELKKVAKLPTAQDKQRFYSELLTLQRERTRSDGWVSAQYKTKFGVWPRGLFKAPIEVSSETRSWITSQNIRYAKRKAKEAVNHA